MHIDVLEEALLVKESVGVEVDFSGNVVGRGAFERSG
jgi:hypothetical protein